jgi:glutaredoxin
MAQAENVPAPEVADLALYQFDACPFCARVRQVIDRLDLDIEIRDTRRNPTYRQELIQQGGKATVPCLRIERSDGRVEWMYESADIIDYLKEQFG